MSLRFYYPLDTGPSRMTQRITPVVTGDSKEFSSTSVTINFATGVNGPAVVGDLVFVDIHWKDSPGTVTPPTGWLVANECIGAGAACIGSYYKVWTASDPSTAQWTWTTSRQGIASMLARVGNHPMVVKGNTSCLNTGAGSASSITLPSLNVPSFESGFLHIVSGSNADVDHQYPSPAFHMTDFQFGSSDMAQGTEYLALTGATGTRVITFSPAVKGVAQMIWFGLPDTQTIYDLSGMGAHGTLLGAVKEDNPPVPYLRGYIPAGS